MDASEALMYMLEGGCPHCDADLKITRIGGIRSWLDSNYGMDTHTLALASPVAVATMSVLECEDEDLDRLLEQWQGLMREARDPDYIPPSIPEWDAPDGAPIDVWQDRDDPISGEIGMIMMACPECGRTYEAYALTSGDYVLAGHPEFEQL